jgi:hypothetical protein
MKRQESVVVSVKKARRSRRFGVAGPTTFLKIFETNKSVDTLLGLLLLSSLGLFVAEIVKGSSGEF